MLTDTEITAGTARLTAGKLSGSDVDSLVSTFRLLLGPLEDTYDMNLVEDLEALDDTTNTRKKAAKMAACLIRLIAEDFGVSYLTGGFENSDYDQRRLFTIYALSILYKIPPELMDSETFNQAMVAARRFSSSVPITFVPVNG
jgi:hypothetical protein